MCPSANVVGSAGEISGQCNLRCGGEEHDQRQRATCDSAHGVNARLDKQLSGPGLRAEIARTDRRSAPAHATAHHRNAHRTAQQHAQQHAQKHAQHQPAPNSTAQHRTAQHSIAQHGTSRHLTAPHGTSRHLTAQHSTTEGRIPYMRLPSARASVQIVCAQRARSSNCTHSPNTLVSVSRFARVVPHRAVAAALAQLASRRAHTQVTAARARRRAVPRTHTSQMRGRACGAWGHARRGLPAPGFQIGSRVLPAPGQSLSQRGRKPIRGSRTKSAVRAQKEPNFPGASGTKPRRRANQKRLCTRGA